MSVSYANLYVSYRNALARRYRFRTTVKEDSPFQQLIASFLGHSGSNVPSRKEYLTTFTTVIYDPLRKAPRLWLPWDPDAPDTETEWWGRVLVLTHEATHFDQMERDGGERFSLQYLLQPRKRGAYEAEAYLVGLAAQMHLAEGAVDVRPWLELPELLFRRILHESEANKASLSDSYGLPPQARDLALSRIDEVIRPESNATTCQNLQRLGAESASLSLLRLILHANQRRAHG